MRAKRAKKLKYGSKYWGNGCLLIAAEINIRKERQIWYEEALQMLKGFKNSDQNIIVLDASSAASV